MSDCRKKSVLLLKGDKKENMDDDLFVSMLSQNGFEVTCIPILGFQFVNLDLLCKAIYHPDEYSCLLLTSPRAVEAISRAVADKELLHSVWSKKPTYAVGSATQLSAENIGLKVKGSESGNSEQLADFIIKDLSIGSFSSTSSLFPCGNMKLETLPNALHAAGMNVVCMTVYETSANGNVQKCLEEFIRDKGFPEYLVFFSPSGVKFAFPHLQKLGFLGNHDVKHVAIGPTTEKAILTQGEKVFGVAAQPTAQHLCQLLTDV